MVAVPSSNFKPFESLIKRPTRIILWGNREWGKSSTLKHKKTFYDIRFQIEKQTWSIEENWRERSYLDQN
jgi:hypothetical protein